MAPRAPLACWLLLLPLHAGCHSPPETPTPPDGLDAPEQVHERSPIPCCPESADAAVLQAYAALHRALARADTEALPAAASGLAEAAAALGDGSELLTPREATRVEELARRAAGAGVELAREYHAELSHILLRALRRLQQQGRASGTLELAPACDAARGWSWLAPEDDLLGPYGSAPAFSSWGACAPRGKEARP